MQVSDKAGEGGGDVSEEDVSEGKMQEVGGAFSWTKRTLKHFCTGTK